MNHESVNDEETQQKSASPEKSVAEAKYWALEAKDPEGHGPNLRSSTESLGVIAAGLALLVMAVFIVAWSVRGLSTAFVAMLLTLAAALLVAVPLGGLLFLRAKSHARLQDEAQGAHTVEGRGFRGRGRWVRPFWSRETTPTLAAQRLDDDGSRPIGTKQPRDSSDSAAAASRG